MKICAEHWEKLRTAIDDRGLTFLVAKDGAKAAQQLTNQINGSEAKEDYDPLMSAYWAITANAVRTFGVDSMREDFGCPLCALDTHAAECKDEGCPKYTGADWIGLSADGQLSIAKEMGLIGEPN
jgi:hypothetical protein